MIESLEGGAEANIICRQRMKLVVMTVLMSLTTYLRLLIPDPVFRPAILISMTIYLRAVILKLKKNLVRELWIKMKNQGPLPSQHLYLQIPYLKQLKQSYLTLARHDICLLIDTNL